jgi:hypothetical protein
MEWPLLPGRQIVPTSSGDERSLQRGTTMSAFRNICVLSALLVYADACVAVAAAVSIPHELVGEWSASTDERCGIKFTAKGFTGSSGGEGYDCQARRVRTLGDLHQDPRWRIVFVCEGEFGKVEIDSLLRLQTIRGKRVMAQTATLSPRDTKKAAVPPLSVLHECR